MDLSAQAWQQSWYAWLDIVRYLVWWFVGGLVACGGCSYMGQLVYTEWVRENPPPRLRFLAERRLRRDVTRGLADLEKYLGEREHHS